MLEKGSRVRIASDDFITSPSNGKIGVVLGAGDAEFDQYGVDDLDYILRVEGESFPFDIVRVFEKEVVAI
jgi:hypothetical protein